MKDFRFELLCWGIALIFGIAVGYVNLHASEVQVPVLAILVFTFLLGYLHPRRAWLWALIVGLSILLSYIVAPLTGYHTPYPPSPNIFATLIALIPACIGAYAGVLTRKVILPTRNQQP